jgi:hypothetical protein
MGLYYSGVTPITPPPHSTILPITPPPPSVVRYYQLVLPGSFFVRKFCAINSADTFNPNPPTYYIQSLHLILVNNTYL